ncbi:hypothetical protein NXS19_012693 [Fusarium pseudograminearum]|nr:hypothetical protein NXS19_012693 [Fusarium pseudograminearum]
MSNPLTSQTKRARDTTPPRPNPNSLCFSGPLKPHISRVYNLFRPSYQIHQMEPRRTRATLGQVTIGQKLARDALLKLQSVLPSSILFGYLCLKHCDPALRSRHHLQVYQEKPDLVSSSQLSLSISPSDRFGPLPAETCIPSRS